MKRLCKTSGYRQTTAAAHGRVADLKEWRLVISAHLSDSRDQAFAEARVGAGRHQYEYFAQTLGVPTGFDGPPEEIIDEMARRDLLVHRYARRPDRHDREAGST